MKIDKDQILQLLKSQGQHDKAGAAESELPDHVDTDDEGHKNLLAKLGIDPSMITDKLGGGGLGGALGKLI